ncbi:MAG: hypothetical protein NVS3B15_08210 [Sediminibacterium sp.]
MAIFLSQVINSPLNVQTPTNEHKFRFHSDLTAIIAVYSFNSVHLMRAFIWFVLLLLFAHTIAAQSQAKTKISGKVVDAATQKPIEYATITITGKQSALVNGTVTDARGAFEIQHIPVGRYTVVVDFIGYHPCKIDSILINESKIQVHLKINQLTSAQ